MVPWTVIAGCGGVIICYRLILSCDGDVMAGGSSCWLVNCQVRLMLQIIGLPCSLYLMCCYELCSISPVCNLMHVYCLLLHGVHYAMKNLTIMEDNIMRMANYLWPGLRKQGMCAHKIWQFSRIITFYDECYGHDIFNTFLIVNTTSHRIQIFCSSTEIWSVVS